jgi:hypothetical protein
MTTGTSNAGEPCKCTDHERPTEGDNMTKLRKSLLAVAIAAAVTVPVGVAYAADGTGAGPGPAAGMTSGPRMDPADCQKDHAAHQAQMGQHSGAMSGMRDHPGMNDGAMHDGTGSMSGG